MLEIENIELRNVSHGYGDGSNAINKLNLKVTSGELICVLGPSGCGKSTILKILAGQLKPNEGEIFCNGQSLYENLKEILQRENRLVLYEDCLNFLKTRVDLDLALFKEDIWAH